VSVICRNVSHHIFTGMREVCAATLASVQVQRVLSFALCCSVLQCVSVCRHVLHCVTSPPREHARIARCRTCVRGDVLRCVVVCWLQCGVLCCSVFQYVV